MGRRRKDDPRPPLTAARRDLAARHLPLALGMARDFHLHRPAHFDDFRAEALLGLVEAAGTYDESCGVRFGTFARHRIRGALLTLLARVTADEARYVDEAGDPAVLEALEALGCVVPVRPPAPPAGRAAEAAREVAVLLARLPARHAEAVRLVALDGRTFAAAGAALGCGLSHAHRLHAQGMALLREQARGRRDHIRGEVA